MDNIDTKPKVTEDALASRARDGGSLPDPAVVARDLENDPRLRNGASIREIILADPRVRLLMVTEAIRGLGATTQCWNAKIQAHESKADYATRHKFISFLAGYSDGLPAATLLTANVTPSRPEPDTEEMLAASPAAREQLARTLARAEKRAKERSITAVAQ